MGYQVLARKYRPPAIADVAGQDQCNAHSPECARPEPESPTGTFFRAIAASARQQLPHPRHGAELPNGDRLGATTHA